MSLKKICHRVEEIPFLCPLCKGNIQRLIKEDNIISIDSKGEPKDVENLLFDDFFECSKCHEPLSDIVDSNGLDYRIITKGIKKLLKDKNKERLSINPFGKI